MVLLYCNSINLILCEYKEKIMKKAFTLSEALVTLAIIAVLFAILIPVIDNVRPDKDKVYYKKALYDMQNAVANAMDSTVYSVAANSAAYWADDNIPDHTFCQSIADALNTSGAVHCGNPTDNFKFECAADDQSARGPLGSCYSSPNFITSDGIRYWGLEGKIFSLDSETGRTREIYVDRPISDSEFKKVVSKRGSDAQGLKIRVSYDGKIDTADTDKYDYENDLIENSLQLTKTQE